LVHELRVDIPQHAGELIAKPPELVGEDLPKDKVEAVVESNPQILGRFLRRGRNLEPPDRRFELRCG
jgi:hypothetical protein